MRFVSMEEASWGVGQPWKVGSGVGVSADSGCGAARGGSAGCEVCRVTVKN